MLVDEADLWEDGNFPTTVLLVNATFLAEHPQMSVDDLKKKLLASTDPVPVLKGKTVTGGRINAAKALD